MSDSDFFAATKPLEKSQILEIFKDVLRLTKLFVAPFGLPHDAADILGDFIAKKDYKTIHRCWEDFTARKVYTLKNVSDDRVAASLQYYLETKNDYEMVEAMKVNEKAASSMLAPQRVVPLPSGEGVDLEDLACTAFLSVATAWKRVEDEFTKGVTSSTAKVLDINSIHPCDIGYIVSFLSVNTIEKLLTCLDNLSCVSGEQTSVSLNYEQYVALLDIHLRASTGPVSPRVKLLFASLDTLIDERTCVDENAQAEVVHDRVKSLIEYYGDLNGGAKTFLRRLQSLGWKQAMLYKHTNYLSSASTPKDRKMWSSTGSPFSHPVISSMVYLEEMMTSAEVEGFRSEDVLRLDRVYTTSMELLGVYDSVMKKRYSNGMGEMKSDQELQQEEDVAEQDPDAGKDNLLDAMFTVEEAISKFERDSKELMSSGEPCFEVGLHLKNDLNAININDSIFAQFLLERAVCRIKTEEVQEALEDIMHALRIDPKCAAAYKSRFKIYSKLAMMAAQDEEEGVDDEEEEDESKPDSKTLLMKSAYDALAAFILDGSTNILLAGAAEDATREACRAEAKEYFWDRNGDDSDNDSDWSDDDSEEGSAASNDEDVDVKEKDDEEDDIPQIGGSIAKLRSCIGTAEELDANRVLFDSILESSTLPRSWLVNSYMTLFAPLNIAFDLTSEMVANQVNHVDDGLDEEGKTIPFMHLLDISNVSTDDEATSDESAPCELKEGDMDSFKLLCTVVGLLMKCKSACPDTSAIDKSKHVAPVTPSTSDVTVFPENDGNKVSLAFVKATGKDVENDDDSGCIDDSEVKVEVWSVDSLLDMTTEVFGCQGTDIFESGRFSSDLSESKVTSRGVDDEADDDDYVKLNMKDLVLNDCDFPGVAAQKDSQAGTCNASVNFQEAFSLVCSGEASALTGVEFKWCKKGDTDNACYRLHVEVMDSVMSGKAEEGKDVVEGDDVTTSRDVSPKLRSRLLSLCGSIAYLCGDAMGGYKCLKASILLDDNLLDSRLKISSILLEMDELDKAEAQLMEASHRPKWEEDICLNLHLAELHLHRMEYFPAVRILRSTSRRLDFLLEGWEGLVDEKEVARHIGPTIVSLHGVAEFRVNPETPLRALNILQKGIKTFPDNVSLCVCYGEVLGQAGDPAGALKSYSDASAMEPNHPLPFLNASRVYQQLNQMQLCKKHMEKAFNLDKSLSLTLVDIAQFKLHEKRFSDQGEAAVSSPSSEEEGMFFEDLSSEEILETAVDVSRHVSEVIDVFTAKQIARFYAKLGASGLAPIFL